MEFWRIVLIAGLVLGVSSIFWSIVGLMRFTGEQFRRGRRARVPGIPAPADVAVLVAAHNEELVIADTIRSASALVPLENIHVISDMSTDRTAELARAAGVNVLELEPNRGKAGALAEGIQQFGLCHRFQVVLLLDADTRPSPDYLVTGLPLFADPGVAAVAGRAKSLVRPHPPSWMGRFLVAYRERLYVVVQTTLKYGQAARGANVVSIVPGFASMYRTTALPQIDIVAKGLVIEDFNMTFELHARQLGRIAFHPGAAVAYTQDPDTLHDYIRQVRRWTLGFWQTVRRHKSLPAAFRTVLLVHIFELFSSGLLLLLLVPVFALSLAAGWVVEIAVAAGAAAADPAIQGLAWASGVLPAEDVLLGVILPDFLLTIMAAVASRRPVYLLFGLAFPLVRILDSAICLSQFPKAWLAKSTGVWKSPSRRVQAAGSHSDGAPENTPEYTQQSAPAPSR